MLPHFLEPQEELHGNTVTFLQTSWVFYIFFFKFAPHMLSMMDIKSFFSPVDKHAQFCYWAPALSVVNPVPQRCLRPGATCGRPVFLSAMTSGQKYLKKAPKPLGPFEGHWHPATVMLPQEEEGACRATFCAAHGPAEPFRAAHPWGSRGASRSMAAISCLGPHFPERPFHRKKQKGKKGGGHTWRRYGNLHKCSQSQRRVLACLDRIQIF